jgi:glycine dehydrogenase subunit 1
MRYTQLTDEQVSHMLATIGVNSIDDLFSPIPADLRLKEPLQLHAALSEPELLADVASLGARNADCTLLKCFLGAGIYDHFIPTVVDAMAGQSEFVTAYTPYQAEASQGILQAFYEFQTLICQLTGMEVANASLYEGASSAAEAVIMATAITKRPKVLIGGAIHPDTRAVLKTYGVERAIECVEVPEQDGVLDEAALADVLSQEPAALVIQSPNFYGCLERLDRIIPKVQEAGALVVVATDPIACGMLKSPGALGADVVVGEGQSLGIPMHYGGPILGLLATKEKHLRKMPGRVVGVSADREGRRSFCLALQTREQHIKRERATSNVCTNQGLMAMRAAVYMAAMGRNGLAEVARQCFDKAHYAAAQISKIEGYELRFAAPFFKEFAVRTTRGVPHVLAECRRRGLLGGVPLARFDKQYKDCFLVAVTERRRKEEIDALVAALAAA